jgi:hypothetical protein
MILNIVFIWAEAACFKLHVKNLPFQQFNHIVILKTTKYFELPKITHMCFLIFSKCDGLNYGMLL